MFKASAPAPKLMSPITVPFSTLKVSAPEPRRTSPTIVGSAASGTPSPSLSGAVLPVAARTPNWRMVTPLVLAARSSAICWPSTAVVSAVLTVRPAPIAPELVTDVRLPDRSRTATESPWLPATTAVMVLELVRPPTLAPAPIRTPVATSRPSLVTADWIDPVFTRAGAEVLESAATAVASAFSAAAAIVPSLRKPPAMDTAWPPVTPSWTARASTSAYRPLAVIVPRLIRP